MVSVFLSLPSYSQLSNRDVPESSKIYSRDGTLLYEFYGEQKRTTVKLDQVSKYLKDATIAIEDKDFYNHGAVSFSSIVRAGLANYKAKETAQGGSTITQQYAKNALLTRDKLYSRKIREVLLSYKIEAHYSKDQILELYFNEIPYGRNSYGIEAASQTYFGKSAKDVNLAESAYLAALPQAPSFYSPTSNMEALNDRKNLVLQRMKDQGYITDQEYNEALTTQVAFLDNKTKIVAPYFVSWVQSYLTETYGEKFLREGGLKVYTSLDLKLQNLAEQVVKEGAQKNKSLYSAYNASLVAVDPKTNQVLAMVGGKDYFAAPEPKGCTPGANCRFEPSVNVADRLRQPGSSFKPYAYLTAFKPEFGYTPLSKVSDIPTVFGYFGGKAYIPQDYDGGSRGIVTMRKALAGSLNIPAVHVVQTVGVDNTIKTARDLGITAPFKNCGLSLVLGGCEVKLVDHTRAFSALANGGKLLKGSYFKKIEDKNGKVLEEQGQSPEQVVNPEAVYELISIMTDDQSRQYIFGKNNPLTLPDRPVAAKTGTTQQWKDAWTVGFTPQLAVGVWTGNNDGSLMRAGSDGIFTAAPIWHKFMEEAHKGLPVENFAVPNGVIQVAYDPYTNKPSSGNSKNARMEPIPWYAIPKDIAVSAAPKNLNKSLIGPITNTTNSKPSNSISNDLPISVAPEAPIDAGGSNEGVVVPIIEAPAPIIDQTSSYTRPGIIY